MRFVKFMFVILVVLGIRQAGAWAFSGCPSGADDEIFCDDFDTYCDESSTGHPGGTKCPTTGATRRDQRLKEVWLREPRGEDATEMIVADNQSYLTSAPYGGHYPCQGDARLGTMTIRDWEHSPYPLETDGQIRNLAWRIRSTFIDEGLYDAVEATDERPLVIEFMVNGLTSDKIDWDNGYVEVTLGSDRANTDYIEHQSCSTYCNPPINKGPFSVICAQGNPTGPLPTGCPNVGTYPPPIRASIAVGMLAMLDPDPCKCGSEQAHASVNYHLNVYDGQRWWMLRNNSPLPSTGTMTPKGDAPWPPVDPTKLPTPGNFELGGGSNNGKAYNWVKLTIKSQTFMVELTTQDKDPSGNQYYTYSVMDNIPRAYKFTGTGPADFSGAFDGLRIGVGQACQLQSNTSWETCSDVRKPMRSNAIGDLGSLAGALDFDDLALYGGRGYSLLGACCLPNGTCADPITEGDCVAQGGVYRGPSSVCGDGSTCLGACCKGEAAGCSDILRKDCPAPYTYKGEGTRCASTTCPCSVPFADADLDGDVDQMDFAAFQACFSGPGPLALSATCKCFDRDNNGAGDQDVDMDDLAKFEACASGPGVALKPTCN
jgi:hypothetical protein